MTDDVSAAERTIVEPRAMSYHERAPGPGREDSMTDQDKAVTQQDDTEGHMPRIGYADAQPAEGDDDTEGDDTEGHGRITRADAESAEGDDDVTGHVYIENRDDLNQQRLR
jgi:hypothetical protein